MVPEVGFEPPTRGICGCESLPDFICPSFDVIKDPRLNRGGTNMNIKETGSKVAGLALIFTGIFLIYQQAYDGNHKLVASCALGLAFLFSMYVAVKKRQQAVDDTEI
jgi:hypothetical protein